MKTGKKRLLAVLLAVMMVLSVIPFTALAANADIEISTLAELQQFAADVNGGNTYEGKTVVLTVNISLGGENNPWTPIGTSANAFQGTFDGNCHVVSGLYIASGANVGLFGYVNGGTVRNLVVEGSITGSSNVAGIVGYLNGGKISNCGNRATVKGGSNVAGVAGYLNGTCTVSGCYNSGNITGTTGFIGGVTGQHWRAGEVINCYNSGTVNGPATVGGIAGGHKKANATVLTNCYNVGNVVNPNTSPNNHGSILGGNGTATNCYDLSGSAFSGVGNSGATVNVVTTLSASDLSSAFVDGTPYPTLSWENAVCTDAPVRPLFVEKTELSARLSEYIKAAVNSTKSHSGVTDTLLGNEDYMSGASSTATDWMAMAMGRFGYFDGGDYYYLIDDGTGYEDYLAAMQTYIENTYADNNGILHSAKATEWHRAVVAIAALGGDPTSFGTYNGASIDLVADGSYNNALKAGPGTQGINGWIWGLISMDTGMYEVPANAKYTRATFITEILKLQLTDGVNGNEYGGWVLGGYGSSSDVDITAMAIQALAPYYNDDTVYTYTNANSKAEVSKTVRQCVDEALDRLGAMQNSNGGFASWNTDNVESISQVVVALCSLGINPAEDERFITASGKTLLDGMLQFRLSDGGFCHVLNGGWNSMANDQATYALVAYWRFENGMRSLYDMRGDWTAEKKTAIETAVTAIASVPSPSSSDYKAKLKSALAIFRAVPETERRYVSNYSALAAGIELVGGEAALDTDTPYITSISITKNPDKTRYYEGESFDSTGMIVTAAYSDGSKQEISDYKISVNEKLDPTVNTVYIIYGALKASVSIEVLEKMPWDGEGTSGDPYLVTGADDLLALAEKVNSGKMFTNQVFVLTDNIDLSNISDWTPIGKSSSYQFDGIFDGQGYVIDNLYSTGGGLFGYVCNHAVIKNVGVGSGEIGTSTGSFMGGIAKWSNGADFINCWNGADIYCSGYSGGIVGTVRDGGESIVKGCYNIGSVYSSGGAIGGIIGHLDTSRNGISVNVTISDCYNAGTITADDNAGGIVGRVQDGHTVKNCYNVGIVKVLGSNILDGAGAIASFVTRNNEITNCYYNSERISCGVSNGTDTATGKTTVEMKSEEFLALLGNSFKADSYALVNNGYPLVYWQKTEDADAIDETIEKINAIGTVTLDGSDAINAARNAYDNLDDELKEYVSNLDVLEQAEKTLLAMQTLKHAKETAVNQLETYKKVSDYRAEQQVELNRIISDGTEVINAAESTEAVAAALADAKAKLDAVKTNEQLTNEESAKAVSDKIGAIGSVTLESENIIKEARSAYDALSVAAKGLVENYDVLMKAESSFAKLKSESNSDNSSSANASSNDNGETNNTSNMNQSESPKTGDNAAIWLYLVLMLSSLCALTVITVNTKRKE